MVRVESRRKHRFGLEGSTNIVSANQTGGHHMVVESNRWAPVGLELIQIGGH